MSRHNKFYIARLLSALVSVAGVFVAAAADSLKDTRLMTIQFVVGIIVILAGIGYYMAFLYAERWIAEKEKRARERQLQTGA